MTLSISTEGAGWTRPLRAWQQSAHEAFVAKNDRDFLCVATPGAGKTVYSLYEAYLFLLANPGGRVVVVTPTDHLRTQWVEAAASVGIDLTGDFRPDVGWESADTRGIVTTYHAVASNSAVYRAQTARPTFVIFDEPHHLGGHRSWGKAVRHAFEHAARRLSITGTPFRSDNGEIPFLTYVEGKTQSDFPYTYGDALRDGVCRPIYFPSYEGRMTWWSGRRGEMTASFEDAIPTEEDARRLNTAIDPQGEWLPEVLRDADARLRDIRASVYADAAGLVIARDQTHARQIARLLAGMTGEEPALAVSDEPDSSAVIERFAKGRSRWIVAVRMVSEGVDIPRLFVGVYATNIMTELYFRQAVGRFVRWLSGVEEQAGWLFIPKVPRLIDFVQRIKEQRDGALEADDGDEEDDGSDRSPREACDAPKPGQLFTPLASEALADVVWVDGQPFRHSELAEARAILQEMGVAGRDEALVARIIRRSRERSGSEPPVPLLPPPVARQTESLDRRKQRARKLLTSLVNRRSGQTGLAQKDIHRQLATATGAYQSTATLEQMEEKIRLLTEWMSDDAGNE